VLRFREKGCPLVVAQLRQIPASVASTLAWGREDSGIRDDHVIA